jgi:hypothetical protein
MRLHVMAKAPSGRIKFHQIPKEIVVFVHRLAIAAFAASVVTSSAFAGADSDHTPLLEQCAAYQREFVQAVAGRPASSPTVLRAQQMYREGVDLCGMGGRQSTAGVGRLAEALQLIGVQPSL